MTARYLLAILYICICYILYIGYLFQLSVAERKTVRIIASTARFALILTSRIN